MDGEGREGGGSRVSRKEKALLRSISRGINHPSGAF
jgi:hypothetical protein